MVAGAADFFVACVFEAKLQAGDVARIQGRDQAVGKGGRIERRRRDQIETTALAAVRGDQTRPL